ncbi:MAG: RsmB/NOP family class I SAM-dependent RNA methyltransferase [Kiritimatiellae bacterium]|jgi:16S rRNA (cytosine967-C5)-methyltransferase|nr:RsmB/NOP family class I SAM-dependent RNA methyltransferase [Kiritimatiellia bacterium]
MSIPETLPNWAPRQAAVVLAMLEATEQGVREGQPADRVLHSLISGNKKYGSRDRRLIGDAVFAWFRWHGAIGTLPLARGLCAAWALEGREWPPALLAMLSELDVPQPESLEESASLEARKESVEKAFELSLPPVDQWLPEWWKKESAHLGEYSDRLREHFHRPPTWLRVDHSAQSRLQDELISDGAEWAGDASPCAYAFEDAGKVRRWMDAHGDVLEIQDLCSQQVVRVCNPSSGETWWDACCGNGGKSLQLLDDAERNLDLTCTDRREEVLKELIKRGRRHGLSKVRRYCLDLLSKDLQLPQIAFDGILLDAPCSGTGTWNRNPDAAWRSEASDVSQAGRRQLGMLKAVAPALSSGGVLVYAVCTLTKTETIDVVSAFLAEQTEFQLDPIAHPLTGTETDGTLTLLPKETRGDGMYIARMVRT